MARVRWLPRRERMATPRRARCLGARRNDMLQPQDQHECERDGAEMFCPNCGNQLADGAKFCPKCGKPVARASNAAQAPAAQSPAPVPAYAPAPAPVPAPKKKPKVIIGVIAGIVVFAVVILTLVLTGVWGGGPLTSIPEGAYRIVSPDPNGLGEETIYAITIGEDGEMSFSLAFDDPDAANFTCTLSPDGTLGNSTMFTSGEVHVSATNNADFLDDVTQVSLLVPNGIAAGNPVGVWAIQYRL